MYQNYPYYNDNLYQNYQQNLNPYKQQVMQLGLKGRPVTSYDEAKAAAINDDSKTIYVSDNLKGQYLKKVLCHEITHAAMFSYNVYLTLDQEELIANIIATYGDEIISITNKVFQKIRGAE